MKRLFIVLTMLLLVATAFAQNITNAEYFFDKDPGPGNGHPTAVGTPGTVVNFPVTIPINLSPGFHWLGVRVKDENGKWGLFDRRSFYISQGTTDLPIITKAEYFFDNDPGVGNGSPLNIVNTGFAISQIFPVPVPAGMTPGTHLLSIRMRDQAGHWGLFKKDSIIVGGAATISCPANITVSASGGQCTSIVNDIDPVVAPQGTAYTYTLSGSTVASGNGTASGKIFSAGVTTVTYALSSSPTTNCSFSVVVNSAVTPSVSISVTDDTVCSTQSITFTATPINGGSDPAYQWKKNGINVGNGEMTFQANGWTTGDIVTVDMTSSTGCASSIPATSNPITITVVPPSITPTVNITASTTSICPGTLVTFTANSVNGGVPDYAWSINGVYIPGSNGNSFSSSTLVNGDKVRCAMTSTLACVTDVTSVSNEIAMTVIPLLTPQLTIAASATSICSGQQVTFTATPVNGGPDPAYEWRLNGNIVDENNNTYSTSTLQNGDVITATLTSSLNCASPQAVSSNTITMSVSPSTPAIVNITASATTICSGTAVTFSVTATAAGSAYQWQINGINIPGANSTTYQSSSLQNGDKIKVVMTPSSPCATPSPAVSNVITMTVNAIQIPSVSIDASATAICTGQSVIFTAHPVNAGSNTVYEWTLNNNAVGANSTTFQSSTLANGDIIRVSMATTPACGNNTQAVSNTLTMSVSAAVVPSVTMSASTSSTCPGASVTFNAAPVSGAGNGPSYQWKRNGINIPGATNATYQSSSLSNGDVIRVAMTSSLGCANPQTVLSHDSVTMTISSTSLTPSVNVSASVTSICQGQTVTFTALPTNGGQVPVYQWKLNGNNVGSNSEVFSIDTLENGDVITVEMATSVPCFTVPTATSVPVTIIVTAIKTFYADFDGDGYGDGAASGLQACNAPAGYVFSNSDCDDDNAAVYPGGTEICGNGIDDNCNGTVDENCTTELPQLLVRTYPVKEGDGTYTLLTVEVKLDRPAISQVTVNYATSNANATAGLDYVAASGALTIPVGDSTVIVQLKIIGDVLAESNESFWINFSNPVNVMLGNDPRGRTMIIDDDKGKPGTITRIKEEALETESIKIPEVAKRNTVWMIPQISNYENEVLIMNVMGQVVSRFSNYRNQTPILNVAIGLYFYHVRIKDRSGRYKYYSGRLLITE